MAHNCTYNFITISIMAFPETEPWILSQVLPRMHKIACLSDKLNPVTYFSPCTICSACGEPMQADCYLYELVETPIRELTAWAFCARQCCDMGTNVINITVANCYEHGLKHRALKNTSSIVCSDFCTALCLTFKA